MDDTRFAGAEVSDRYAGWVKGGGKKKKNSNPGYSSSGVMLIVGDRDK